jgi:hypothetical protein
MINYVTSLLFIIETVTHFTVPWSFRLRTLCHVVTNYNRRFLRQVTVDNSSTHLLTQRQLRLIAALSTKCTSFFTQYNTTNTQHTTTNNSFTSLHLPSVTGQPTAQTKLPTSLFVWCRCVSSYFLQAARERRQGVQIHLQSYSFSSSVSTQRKF